MKLNYKTFGQGPALIILHGLFGSLDNWVSLGKRLADHFSVYLLDQRNHGRSPHSPHWDYPTMAEDVNDFMDAQGIFTASILGHSMGGKTAMQFASYYPERLERLVVADMAPKAYPPHHKAILDSLNSVDLQAIESRSDAEAQLETSISEPAIRQFLLKSLYRKEEGDFAWRFNLEVITQCYPNVLAAIEFLHPVEIPALFIYGGRSNYIGSGDRERISEYFPAAEFEELPHAGHWLHAEEPETFLANVQRFLES